MGEAGRVGSYILNSYASDAKLGTPIAAPTDAEGFVVGRHRLELSPA